MALVNKQEEIAKKNAEIDQFKVKVADLNRQIDQVRSSKYLINALIDSRKDTKKHKDDNSGLGYQDVPPPATGNYSFLPTEKEVTEEICKPKLDEMEVDVSESEDSVENGSSSNVSMDEETGEVFKNTKGSGVNKGNTIKTNPTESKKENPVISKTQTRKAEPKIILKNPKFVKQGEAKTEEIKQGNAECSGNTSPKSASNEGSTSRGQYK